MTNKYLIIGASGAIGHAFATAVQAAGEQATLLVRDRRKAFATFGDTRGLTIVEGDVNDTALLKNIAEGAKFIFHGANVSYEHWATAMPVMTRSIIEAAEHAGATVIFPGNNYNFGQTEQPISEITPFNPNAPLGKIRVDLERMLQQATDQGRIRTLVVRMAEIWGPNVTNKQFAPIFENALQGKTMPWLISADTAQQLLFAPDAGRAIYALTQREDLESYEVYNVGGTLVPTIRKWMENISQLAGESARISVTPKAILRTLGLVLPVAREVVSLSYKYETTVLLNDDRFMQAEPDFQQTSMSRAIAETLDWFARNGSNSDTNRKKRARARKNRVVRFTVDNIAIAVFPLVLTMMALQVPVLDRMIPYMAVAAGIYWTPAFHGLSNRLMSRLQNSP